MTDQITDVATPAAVRIDDEALQRWVNSEDAYFHTTDEPEAGSWNAGRVDDAIAAGALRVPADVCVQVNGDDDSEGAGFYVLVRPRRIGIDLDDARPAVTDGWQNWDDVLAGIPSADDDPVRHARHVLEILAQRIGGLLDAVGRPPIVVCVRDPDFANAFEVFGGEVDIIDIDLGASDLRDGDEAAEWREHHHAQVERLARRGAHDAAQAVRDRVAEALNDEA